MRCKKVLCFCDDTECYSTVCLSAVPKVVFVIKFQELPRWGSERWCLKIFSVPIRCKRVYYCNMGHWVCIKWVTDPYK